MTFVKQRLQQDSIYCGQRDLVLIIRTLQSNADASFRQVWVNVWPIIRARV